MPEPQPMQPSDGAAQHSADDADAAAPRLTPYEMVFGSAEFEHRMFPRLLDEAEAAGEDPAWPERFSFLTLAGDALRLVTPHDAAPEVLEQHRALLYHAFNFWRFGRRLYSFDRAVMRYLVEAAPAMKGWELALPRPALYLQLPPNLFWASISPEAGPEPVDGFFVAECRGNDPLGPLYRRLNVLMVLGIRRERAGFSIIPFETQTGPGIASDWAEARGREGGADFASVLPGGDMAGLYSILTTSEALKLLARALWYIAASPTDVTPAAAPERRAHDRSGSIAFSRLPFHRVRLGAGGNSDAGAVAPARDA